MSIAVEKPVVTPEQLLSMPDSVGYELIDGELRERNMSTLSSYVGGTVYFLLRGHVMAHRLGWVFPSDNGFQCFPDSPKSVRRPDASFVRSDRLGVEGIGDGWLHLVPDLVVEVVSPNDLMYEVEQKIEEYCKVGVPLIWVVIPPTRSVRIIRADGSSTLARNGDELSGEAVVPGFRCPVADLFLPVAPGAAPSSPA